MRKLIRNGLFLFLMLVCILFVSNSTSTYAADNMGEYGISVSTYDNKGKSYNDWWGESEVVAYIEGLTNEITRGGYGVSVIVNDYMLLDGQYGVEVSLCHSRSPYDYFSYIGAQFSVRNGKIVPNNDSDTAAFRKTSEGYIVDLAGGYASAETIKEYVVCIKLHSSVTEKNGSVLFNEFFFADRYSGLQILDIGNKKLKVSAERLHTGESVPASVKAPPRIEVTKLTNILYTGNTFKVSASDKNGGTLKYSSSNKSVATISSKGKITAKAPGTTKITIKNAKDETYSWTLTVEAPSLSPVTVKSKVLLDSSYSYKVEAKGYKSGEIIWTSSNNRVGVIGKKNGVFHAKNPGKTTLTATDSAGYSYKIKVEVYEDETGIASYIVMHGNPEAGEKLENLIYEHLLKVYKNVYEMFGDGNYHYIDVYFDHIDFAAAYATIGSQDNHNEIHIGIETMTNNINDVDCATHELIHTAQNYPFSTASGDDRTWLGEGLTDYGRYLLGVQNDKAGWNLYKYQEGQHYTDSYRTTASFIKYVVDVHDPAFAQELNQAFRDECYTEELWKKATGYTIDQLWEMYKKW